jgi:hypothetical protein
MPRRAPLLLLVGLATLASACDSGGSAVATAEAGADAGADTGDLSDDGPSTLDASDASDALPPCLDLDAGLASKSDDCVYAGRCPFDCLSSTASAYACLAAPDGAATYPSVFEPPADLVDIVATIPSAYPWDAGAYVTCGGLTCTRWATADHVDGGSAWSGDPCAPTADAALPPFAWACPASPGVVPPLSGCVSAGDLQAIGGGDSGLPVDSVWCCPPPTFPDSGAPPGDDGGGDGGGPADGGAG